LFLGNSDAARVFSFRCSVFSRTGNTAKTQRARRGQAMRRLRAFGGRSSPLSGSRLWTFRPPLVRRMGGAHRNGVPPRAVSGARGAFGAPPATYGARLDNRKRGGERNANQHLSTLRLVQKPSRRRGQAHFAPRIDPVWGRTCAAPQNEPVPDGFRMSVDERRLAFPSDFRAFASSRFRDSSGDRRIISAKTRKGEVAKEKKLTAES